MLLPLGVEYHYERVPWATVGLIAACVVVFVAQQSMPGTLLDELICHPDTFKPWQWLTSVFMHADIMHLGGNMLFLWVYGRYIEERLGPARFVAVYLGLGIAASWAFIGANLGDPIPALGASGAISGIMGLVLAVAAMAKVDCIIWLRHYVRHVKFPAAVLLGIWVMGQVLMALVGMPGIAISAHLGGFATGLALGLFLRSNTTAGTDWHLRRDEGDYQGLLSAREEATWREIANHHRQKRLAARAQQAPADAFEQAQLARWNRS